MRALERLVAALAVALPALAACKSREPGVERSTTTTSAAAEHREPHLVVTFRDVGLESPEAVLYDDVQDLYIVSNGGGFVSQLSPDGTVKELKWITRVTAPRGLAIAGDTLHVAEADVVRRFDRHTGVARGTTPIRGSVRLDGMATDEDQVFVADRGRGSRQGAIFAIDVYGRVKRLATEAEADQPTALAPVRGGLWVTTASGTLLLVDENGRTKTSRRLSSSELEGVVPLGASVLVSSRSASAVLRGRPGADLRVAIDGLAAPGDLGYDRKRERLVVPLAHANEVRVYEMR